MSPESTPERLLAPLQHVMLRDSHEAEGAGHHVEQVDIVFKSSIPREAVTAAWAATVARTEALRIAFVMGDEGPLGWEPADVPGDLSLEDALPDSWPSWFAADRCRRLLQPHRVPWRATFWPEASRFVWTFHHALVDGRSICRILRAFLRRITGEVGDDLLMAKWPAPTPAVVALAVEMFNRMPADLEPPDLGLWSAPTAEGPARCRLGVDFIEVLDAIAAALESTTATLLTWAWGQALAETGGVRGVLVEQVRAGLPQPGTAGFTMNTLPVVILRAGADEAAQSLREFRAQLLALRAIESVSPKDFPQGDFPDTNAPTTSVIMIERASFSHLAEAACNGSIIESLALHEGVGETIMATASILPDLRLEVEGLRRHDLLAAWRGVLERLSRDFAPKPKPG